MNRVADAMLRELGDGDENMEEKSEDSDEHMETRSERLRRYQDSSMCEVSDPEEWMELHHGTSQPNSEDEAAENEP